MARSRDGKRQDREQNRWIIAIPLIAIAIIAAVYVALTLPSPGATPVMNFSDKLLVELNFANGSQNGYITPTATVGGQRYPTSLGEPGGLWGTHEFDRYGIAGNYPLYMDNAVTACPSQHACTFNVKSTIAHNYTLSDFMAVWGYPTVSQNDTLNVKSNGNYEWELCIGPTGSAVPDNAWGAMILSPNLDITLVYYDVVKGFGCA